MNIKEHIEREAEQYLNANYNELYQFQRKDVKEAMIDFALEMDRSFGMSEMDKARFWSNCSPVTKNHSCSEWQGRRTTAGYGMFRLTKEIEFMAHRVSFALVNNRDINSLATIAHKCDNPVCVNPHHLFETDDLGNKQDWQIKYRQGRSKIGKTSKYIGVSKSKRDSRYKAGIRINRVYAHLGFFDSEIDAALAYDRMLLLTYGEQVNLDHTNVPEFWKENGRPEPLPNLPK